MGQQAEELAPDQSMSMAVAFHPKRDLLAIGFSNGLIRLVNLADDTMLALRGGGDGAIDHLAWSGSGKHLAYASLTGFCGIMAMEDFIRERIQ